MNKTIKIGVVILGSLVILSIGLAQMEYRYFVQQSAKMIALQEDYQNHIAAIDKVLAEYNTLKELAEQTDLASADEKKKRNPWITIDTDSEICFPESPLYSSDDEPDEEGSFPIINRELEYLKQSAIHYIRKQDLEILLNRLGQDEWQDYQQILELKAKPKGQAQKKRRVKSAKKQPKKQPRETVKQDMYFEWPVNRSECWLSSFFGPRRKPGGGSGFHYGLDMAAVKGTPVHAAAEGMVVEARNAKGYGKTIVVSHNRKYRTRYAHLDKILVKVGQKVHAGTLIGRVGDSGFVRSRGGDASHLHFEVSAYGKKVNPIYYLNA